MRWHRTNPRRRQSDRASRAQLDRLAAALAPYDAGREYLNFAEQPTDAQRFFAPGVPDS